jgi:hypothetical protein
MKYSFDPNVAMGGTPIVDSLHEYLERTTGERITKTVTLAANNTSESLNCFQVTGTVRLLRLYGKVLTGTLTNMTAVSFNLWDGTSAVQLTKTDGVLTGKPVGTIIGKNAALGTTMFVCDPTAGAVNEGTTGINFYAALITQKTATATYVRLTYTTNMTPIAGTIQIWAEYVPIGVGTLIAV